MPAQEIWINKIEIASETSNRIYTVSQHRVKRHWACSCPGYRTHRKCKHLESLGLPGKETAFEMPKKGFMDGYRTSTDGRRGNPADWRQAAAAAFPNQEERLPEPIPEPAEPIVVTRRIRSVKEVA